MLTRNFNDNPNQKPNGADFSNYPSLTMKIDGISAFRKFEFW